MPLDTRSVGALLRDRRERLGLRQIEVAETARIDYRYLRRIEAGEVRPTRVTYQKIASALAMSADEMDALIGEGNAA